MNKFNSIYPTQQPEPEKQPLKDTFNRFSRRLDEHIRHNVGLKNFEHLRQSTQMMEQLQKIKQRSGKYKRRIYEQEKQFEEKVEDLIKYDIRKYGEYEHFFKDHFDQLEERIATLRNQNSQYRQQVESRRQELKTMRRQFSAIALLSAKDSRYSPSEKHLTTKESSVRLSVQSRSTRIKTDSSLPQLRPDPSLPLLRPYPNQRIKTLMTEYEESPPHQQRQQKRRSGSYMDPIGSIRVKEASSLGLLGQLLSWYRGQVDPESNWFLKVVYNQRNYTRLRSFLNSHSGTRNVSYQK